MTKERCRGRIMTGGDIQRARHGETSDDEARDGDLMKDMILPDMSGQLASGLNNSDTRSMNSTSERWEGLGNCNYELLRDNILPKQLHLGQAQKTFSHRHLLGWLRSKEKDLLGHMCFLGLSVKRPRLFGCTLGLRRCLRQGLWQRLHFVCFGGEP